MFHPLPDYNSHSVDPINIAHKCPAGLALYLYRGGTVGRWTGLALYLCRGGTVSRWTGLALYLYRGGTVSRWTGLALYLYRGGTVSRWNGLALDLYTGATVGQWLSPLTPVLPGIHHWRHITPATVTWGPHYGDLIMRGHSRTGTGSNRPIIIYSMRVTLGLNHKVLPPVPGSREWTELFSVGEFWLVL